MRSYLVPLLGLGGVLSAAFYMHLVPEGMLGAGFENVSVARSILNHGQFADPFMFPTGPTAQVAPLYPTFLAGLLWLLGDSEMFRWAAGLLNVWAQGLIAALLPQASRVLTGESRPGILAGVLYCLLPTMIVLPQWEAGIATLGLLVFLISANSLQSVRSGLLAGLGAGTLLLLSPVLLTILGAWAVWRRPSRFIFAWFAAGAMLACGPWTLRNYQQFGSLFFVRSSLGLELYVSNNAVARAATDDNLASHAMSHPNVNPAEAAVLASMSEPSYQRAKLMAAIQWITTHPGRFAQLTLRRFFWFWFPPLDHDTLHSAAIWIVTLLSVPGLLLMRKHGAPALPFFLAASALFPLVYYLVQWEHRYRYPVLWVSLLSAGYALEWIRSRTAAWLAARQPTFRSVFGRAGA
jgi:hypothetical protein